MKKGLLDRAGGHAAGQGALEDQEEQEGRDEGDECPRVEGRHVEHAVALKAGQGDRDGLRVAGGEHDQRDEELVPRPDEEEDHEHHRLR